MILTPYQQDILDGRSGWAQQIAMRMLVAVGRAHDAHNLIPVSSVHLGLSGMSMGEPGMRFLETLTERGTKFVVPTTLNILSMDRQAAGAAPAFREPEEVQARIARTCETMGALPTYTCNPFLLGHVPQRGQSVAWNESATAPYINSILGAKTNREGATALASAITGLTANYGMHLPENRLGHVLIEVPTLVSGVDDFNLLGGAIARLSGVNIPVIEGLERAPTLDEMTAFCAAFAAISPAAMVHLVGITPEAPTREAALAPAAHTIPARIGTATLERERAYYQTARTPALDMIAVGCPHASVDQVRMVADALDGRSVHGGIRFCIQVSRACADEVKAAGLAARLTKAGVTLLADSCVHVAYDTVHAGQTLATNSLKLAYLMASHDVRIRFGTLNDCVQAAVIGRWPE